jgi:hypothetical protein
MSPADGPDFICIGMPKAGTGWLYDQLNGHPDFWMPPAKELVYLDHPYPPLRFLREGLEAVRAQLAGKAVTVSRRPPTGERRFHRPVLDRRDVHFLELAKVGRSQPRDLDFYALLFEAKGAYLSGDISPPYAALRKDMIASIARRMPHAKILLLVRDPVARAWSRICMSYEGKGFDNALLNDRQAFRAYVEGTSNLGGVFATKVYKRWQRTAPHMAVGVFFFDDIAAAPEKARADILRFLGADPDKKSGDIPPDYNRKEKIKLEMPPLAREVLVEYFREEIQRSAKIFGGAACQWPRQYGL